jgi:hypothetical protein
LVEAETGKKVIVLNETGAVGAARAVGLVDGDLKNLV